MKTANLIKKSARQIDRRAIKNHKLINPHQSQFKYCLEKKEKAQDIWIKAKNPETRFNACQIINAFDELAGQLYKSKPCSKKQFKKTKKTALFIVSLMKNGQWKEEVKQQIQNLEI